MKALTMALCACCFASIARSEPLTREDWALEAVYASVHVMDWNQTRRIAREPRWEEKNRLLGLKPSQARVNGYFAATLVGHVAVTMALPEGYRRAWQASTIVLEISVVRRNARLGVNASF